MTTMGVRLISIKSLLAVTICVTVLFSCGYRFAGGGSLPADIKTIFIKSFENRTGETGIDKVLADELSYQFARSGAAKIVKTDAADAVISGVIQSLTINTVTRKTIHSTSEREIIVSVDIRIESRDGVLIWGRKGISSSETFSVNSDDDSITENNRKLALEKLSQRFAEDVFYRIADNF